MHTPKSMAATGLVELRPVDWGEACAIAEAFATFVVATRGAGAFAFELARALGRERALRRPADRRVAIIAFHPEAGADIVARLMAGERPLAFHGVADPAAVREVVRAARAALDAPPTTAIVVLEPRLRFEIPSADRDETLDGPAAQSRTRAA